MGDGVRPPALIVRAATADDVAAIVELVESSYRGDASRVGWTTEADLLDGQRTDAAAVANAIAADASVVLLTLEDSGALVACCQLEPRHDRVAYFGMFAVRPGLQGGGVGSELLSNAEHYARRTFDAVTMEMTVIAQRKELIAWYERRGYQRTGEMRPFPYGDERYGLPRRDDLHFAVLIKSLA